MVRETSSYHRVASQRLLKPGNSVVKVSLVNSDPLDLRHLQIRPHSETVIRPYESSD